MFSRSAAKSEQSRRVLFQVALLQPQTPVRLHPGYSYVFLYTILQTSQPACQYFRTRFFDFFGERQSVRRFNGCRWVSGSQQSIPCPEVALGASGIAGRVVGPAIFPGATQGVLTNSPMRLGADSQQARCGEGVKVLNSHAYTLPTLPTLGVDCPWSQPGGRASHGALRGVRATFGFRRRAAPDRPRRAVLSQTPGGCPRPGSGCRTGASH